MARSFDVQQPRRSPRLDSSNSILRGFVSQRTGDSRDEPDGSGPAFLEFYAGLAAGLYSLDAGGHTCNPTAWRHCGDRGAGGRIAGRTLGMRFDHAFECRDLWLEWMGRRSL